MNRREFSAGTACLLAATALGLPGALLAQAKRPQEGNDFLTLGRAVPVDAPPAKVEVIEFFWYACPHCNAFEPRLESWIKRQQADVAIRRVPVAFRDDFVPQQRLFYTLEAMGQLEQLHAKVYRAIHAEREALDREDSILAWAGKQGLDPVKFKELYESPAISGKARRARQLQDAYQVQGVPSLGIAGRFYTDGTLAGTMDRALQITDYLVAEVRRAR